MMRARVLVLWALSSSILLGCGSDKEATAEEADAGTVATGWVRGQVTNAEGEPIADVVVQAGASEVRTDALGRFEVEAEQGEVRLAVESKKYSAGTIPVKISDSDANVQVTVLSRKALMLADASKGGRVEGGDGFAVEVPPKGLRKKDGSEAKGPVEVRYVLVKEPDNVSAAPGRMESDAEGSLEGYGMSEVRFYQGGERLELKEKAKFEIPLRAGHDLGSDKMVNVYGLASQDKRWKNKARAKVSDDKVVIESDQAEWLGVMEQLPVDSCVKGRLKGSADKAARNTTIRAARARGLSLVQADTNEDGSFCLPVTPNDDWDVSAFYDDGSGKARGIQVALNSADAVGMCGGDGCKDVGEVELPEIE